MLSRGCPNACTFCTARHVFGRKYRNHSVQRMMDEINQCINLFGAEWFNFEDDNFFTAGAVAEEILGRLAVLRKSCSIELTAMNGISAEPLNEKRIFLMKDAGFREINLALVTHEPKQQQAIRRPFDSGHFCMTVRFAQKAGLYVRGYFILGLPGQTEDEIKAVLELGRELKIPMIPSVYYDVQGKSPEEWKIQRSSAFANETNTLSRQKLICLFSRAQEQNAGFLTGM